MDKQVQEVYTNYDIGSAVLLEAVKLFFESRILLKG